MTKLARSNVRVVAGVPPAIEPEPPATEYAYIQDAFKILWNQKSHWKRPWRGYLDTVPAVKVLRGIGANFNVSGAQAENAAHLMQNCGFSRARIEFSWNNFTYDDPAVMVTGSKTALEQKITACKKYGLRPLILLNANSGSPCPNKTYPLTLTAPAVIGATEIHVEPSQVAGIVLGRTGLSGGSIMGFYLFTEKKEDGTLKLSQPLKVAIPAGKVTNCSLMRFAPWPASVLEDKVTPNPAFEENMLAWLAYAGRTCKLVKELYGSDEFDVEVWNEVSFGTQWLNINNYYEPDVTTVGRQQQAIYTRTVAYLKDPTNQVPNVQIGNGFANQNNTNPIAPGGAALDRHPYPPIVKFPERDETFEPTINNLDGEGNNQGPINKVEWIPTYDVALPEYFLEQIQVESRTFDIAPYGSFLSNSHTGIGGGMGRAPLKSSAYMPHDVAGGLEPAGYLEAVADQGPPRQVWFTEINMFTPASAPGFDEADWRHVSTKIVTRQLLAFINKGVDVMHFFCLGLGFGHYGMVETPFYAQTKEYPGDEIAGETVLALKRIAAAMAGAEDLANPGNVKLDGLVGGEESISGGFKGNPAKPDKYPDLTNKELFCFLPFQVNDSRKFVIAAYVMSRHVHKEHGGTGPSRLDIPAEDYTMTIGGVKGTGAIISAEDPVKGTKVPVTVTGRSGSTAKVKMACSDYPLLITIQEN